MLQILLWEQKKELFLNQLNTERIGKTVALFLLELCGKLNVDIRGKLKSGPAKGRKPVKRYMCIYMAEHMKEFRKWLLLHQRKHIRAKRFPGNNARRRLGISFYNSLIKDNRRFKNVAVHESL